MMWLAILLVGYLMGWVCALRSAMHNQMTEKVRLLHGEENNDPSTYDYQLGVEWLPRGLVRSRNGRDVAVVAGLALLWPVVVAMVLAKGLGGAFVWTVSRLVPPTAPEREREARSREAEIAKLIKEIE